MAHMTRIALAGLLLSIVTYDVAADFIMNIRLDKERVEEDSDVTATCDLSITNSATTIPAWSVVWVKRTTDGDEIEIAAERNVSEKFARTGRYTARKTENEPGKRYTYTLTIQKAKSADSGQIGCGIPTNYKIQIFKTLTVLVPIQSVRMRSQALDKSNAQAYYDGEVVSFADGATLLYYCDVSGSYPEPEVSIFIGDRNITSLFNKTSKLVVDGPTSQKGIQGLHYDTELSHNNLHIGFDFSSKLLRCVAHLPHSNYQPINSTIRVNFQSYKPKFECIGNVSSVRVTAKRYQPQFSYTCDIRAVPAVEDVVMKWDKRQLTKGKRDGHYRIDLFNHSSSDTIKKFVFTIDRIYPQHFRNYVFSAENSQGQNELKFQLVEVRHAVSSTSSVIRSTSCALASLGGGLLGLVASLLATLH